jgi:hypothetical protein
VSCRRRAFSAFSTTNLTIKLNGTPNQDSFDLASSFTLSSTASPGINPLAEAVTLQIGPSTTTIPPGSFKGKKLDFNFTGVIDGVSLDVLIKPTGTLRYAFQAKATGASLNGTENAVYVTLTIGDGSYSNGGATSVTATFR